MKYWILLTLLVLTACSRTETVYFPLDQQAQQPIVQQESTAGATNPDTTQVEAPIVSQNTQSTSTIDRGSEETSSQSTSYTTQSAQANQQTFNISNEYDVTSCCNEGRLSAQAKKERSSYSIDDVKDLLIKIYHDNCINFADKIIQRVYLRFKGDIQDSSYLTYFKSINYKRLQVDYLTVSSDFETCN